MANHFRHHADLKCDSEAHLQALLTRYLQVITNNANVVNGDNVNNPADPENPVCRIVRGGHFGDQLLVDAGIATRAALGTVFNAIVTELVKPQFGVVQTAPQSHMYVTEIDLVTNDPVPGQRQDWPA